MPLVLGREPLEFAQLRLALRGQMQRMGSPVGGRLHALDDNNSSANHNGRAVRHEAAIQKREEVMTMAAVRRDNSDGLFATPAIVAERRSDGSIIVRSTTPLKPSARCIGDWLEHWARIAPDRIYLAERSGDVPWTTVTYGEALKQVRSIAAWLLAQGLSAEHPLVVLSDNSVDHALLALGAMHAGVPVAAISPAYSLMS